MEGTKIWNAVLVEMELAVSRANFNTWFKDTSIAKIEDGVVYVSVPNAFVKEWLSTKYHNNVLRCLRSLSDSVRALEYTISKTDASKKPATHSQTQIWPNKELPLNDYYINKDDNLNPRYTFESFIVGSFNELAHAASQAIVKKPGTVYNPLFIYGKTGNGKTHLIQAVGNHIKNAEPNKKVYYITSEKFAVDYVNSLSNNTMPQFKEKYQKYDVLIMDDIQFFSDKGKTQEELFHLFNTLYQNNKQIIFSSDKHPNFIPSLEDRLKSRFSAGMIVEITPPEHESRAAILRTKASQNNFFVENEIIDFLAASVTGNIREIEGVLNAVIFQSQLRGRTLGIVEIKNLVKNNIKPKKIVSPKEVMKVVADFYNVEEESLTQKTRRKEVVLPRQIVMFLLREDYNISYPSIGHKLGGRDHTTVMHSCEKIKNEVKGGGQLMEDITRIRTMLV